MPLGILLVFVALAGLGTSGTQILLNGFVVNYYRTNIRAAAIGWLAGFGRLGGVAGPVVGGLMLAAGLEVQQIFLVLAGVAVLGIVLLLLIPNRHPQAAEPLVAAQPSLDRASQLSV